MQTRRPRLLRRVAPRPCDERASPARPLAAGDVVLLVFASRVKYRDGTRASQPLRVEVTRVRGERYRGEIIWQPDRRLFGPDELRIGQPVEFAARHVLLIYRV